MYTKIYIVLIFTIPFISFAEGFSEENFIKFCYKDYLKALSSPGKVSEQLAARVRRRCLSKSFLNNWDKIVSVDGTGADGLLLAQDYLETWKAEISVTRHNKNERSVEINLGKSLEAKCLRVNHSGLGSNLRIDTVSACQK